VARAAKYIALLGLFLATVAAAAGAVAMRWFGPGALLASGLAAFMIWLVGSASLALLASAKTPAARLNCALAAMLIRMAVPLLALLYVMSTHHPLVADGIAGLIVVHYLAGLAVETAMAVRIVAASPSAAPLRLPG
jgi:hypothetical protein